MLPIKHFIPTRNNLSMFQNKQQTFENSTFYQDAANIKLQHSLNSVSSTPFINPAISDVTLRIKPGLVGMNNEDVL